ncbi:MAG: hypothetical protein ACREGA_03545 [Candidatus Saccharimonadales bacterium]
MTSDFNPEQLSPAAPEADFPSSEDVQGLTGELISLYHLADSAGQADNLPGWRGWKDGLTARLTQQTGGPLNESLIKQTLAIKLDAEISPTGQYCSIVDLVHTMHAPIEIGLRETKTSYNFNSGYGKAERQVKRTDVERMLGRPVARHNFAASDKLEPPQPLTKTEFNEVNNLVTSLHQALRSPSEASALESGKPMKPAEPKTFPKWLVSKLIKNHPENFKT